MEKTKKWLKKNGFTAASIAVFLMLLVSPDAKAWVMRQILATGLLNKEIEAQSTENPTRPTNTSGPLDFSVIDGKGNTINTSGLRGKVIFINFWASWCPPCRAEFPSVQKFYEKYRGNENVVFLTINMDEDIDKGKSFLIKEKYTVPFLIPNGALPPEIFSGSLPTTVVFDKQGTIRLNHAGMADYSSDSFYQQINGLLDE